MSLELSIFSVTSPQVYTSPLSLSVREGDTAQFRCSASGFPAPVLQWHGGPGGRLPPEAILSNGNGLLTFPVVKEIYEGQYFCTASNMGGISSTSVFLDVSGEQSPYPLGYSLFTFKRFLPKSARKCKIIAIMNF